MGRHGGTVDKTRKQRKRRGKNRQSRIDLGVEWRDLRAKQSFHAGRDRPVDLPSEE